MSGTNSVSVKRTNRGFSLLILILKLFYLLKGVFLVFAIHSGFDLSEITPELNPLNIDVAYLVLIISIFMLSIIIILSKGFFREKRLAFKNNVGSVRFPMYLALSSLCLAVMIIYMRLLSGAVMGMEPANIPWYRGTLVYRSQQYLVPAMFLMVLAASLHMRSTFLRFFALAGLFIFMAAGSILTGSKAGIFFYFLFVGLFYWVHRGELRVNFIAVLIVVVLLLLSFIIGNEVRAQYLFGGSSREWLELMSGELLFPIFRTLMLVFARMIGIEGAALYCSLDDCGLLDFSNFDIFLNGQVGEFYTRDVIGVVDKFDFRAPGLLGGAIIGLGYIGAVFFVVIFSIFWAACSRFLIDRSATPVPVVVLHCGLIFFSIEGTLAWSDLLVLAAAIFLVSILESFFFQRVRGG